MVVTLFGLCGGVEDERCGPTEVDLCVVMDFICARWFTCVDVGFWLREDVLTGSVCGVCSSVVVSVAWLPGSAALSCLRPLHQVNPFTLDQYIEIWCRGRVNDVYTFVVATTTGLGLIGTLCGVAVINFGLRGWYSAALI